MLLSHWNPVREFTQAQQHFADFVGEVLRQHPRMHNGHNNWTPAMDVSETENAYVFTADLPGMKPEHVKVEVKDSTLTVKGERASSLRQEGERVHYRERPTGRFARAFRLTKPVDAGSITAMYRDGVLSVTVPLRAEAKRRKIEIQE
jgi:HSP20 family protein